MTTWSACGDLYYSIVLKCTVSCLISLRQAMITMCPKYFNCNLLTCLLAICMSYLLCVSWLVDSWTRGGMTLNKDTLKFTKTVLPGRLMMNFRTVLAMMEHLHVYSPVIASNCRGYFLQLQLVFLPTEHMQCT